MGKCSEILYSPNGDCQEVINNCIWTLKGKFVYRNGEKYGEFLSCDNEDRSVVFIVTCGNKYSNGQERKIYFT